MELWMKSYVLLESGVFLFLLIFLLMSLPLLFSYLHGSKDSVMFCFVFGAKDRIHHPAAELNP